jgi:hypothetical protein
MTRQEIHEKIIQTLKNFWASVPFSEKYHNFVYLKLIKFEEKLSQLPPKELQNILKNLELISLFQHDEQLHHHLKLLKQHIKNNPKHQYHHLVPLIDFFIQSYTKKSFLILEEMALPKISRNLISDEEINNLENFCCLIEGAGLLLDEIAYFEIIQIIINHINWGPIVGSLSILIASIFEIGWIRLVVCNAYNLMLNGIIIHPVVEIIISMSIIATIVITIVCLYISFSKSNEYIFLKSNMGKLHECLIQIHLHKKIEEWAVVSLKKLPTEINACIGGFFANAESIEKRLFNKEQALEQPIQPTFSV